MRELTVQEVEAVGGGYGPDLRYDMGMRQLWRSFGGRGISFASQAFQFGRFSGGNLSLAFTAGYAIGTFGYNSYVKWKY
tara:strand:- start:4194 stop:4430 length:237 start_codon:yes stop_codon:yes gene_type:complete